MSNEEDVDCEKMSSILDKKYIDLDTYRKLVKNYMDMHLYTAALFWADKVVSISNENLNDVCILAQCMYLMKQYHRAVHLIKSRGLEKKNVMCHYLVVRCLLEAKELTEAVQVINEFEALTNINNQTETSFDDHSLVIDDTPKNLLSAILYVKGKVYEAMDNRAVAIDCYKRSLHHDVYSYQAFEALVQNQMLSATEEQDLLNSLPFTEQCKEADAELVKLLYESKLKKYHAPTENNLLVSSGILIKDHLRNNLDIKVSEAERLYYNCNYHQCAKLTESILKSDPYHSGCLPVHIACLVELKKTNELFYLAHKLVDLYPDLALSWFAVGCYYYIIGKSDPARRYLAKATSLDRLFGPAWLAYGHSFAFENEHDQAMAAYFKASQLMKGCHLPLLYIGLECGLTNNLKLADKFFQQAQNIAPDDPFVIHETGVIAFCNGDFKSAEKLFKDALKKIQSGVQNVILPEKWEALLNNLGHTCRKMKKYEEALDYHQQALLLNPMCPSTYAAIGFIQALIGNTQEAIDSCHRALGIRRDDTFTTTLLGSLMEQILAEESDTEIMKYPWPPKFKDVTDHSTEKMATTETDDPEMKNLKVQLFSEWADNSTKNEEFSANEVSSEVEMLDSSNMIKE